MNKTLLYKGILILLLLTVACSVHETPERKMTVSSTVQPLVKIQTTPSTAQTLSVKDDLQSTPSLVTLAPSTTLTKVQPCFKPKEEKALPQSLKMGTLLLYDRQDRNVFRRDLATEIQSDLNNAMKNGVFASPDKKSFAYLLVTEGNNYQLNYSRIDDPTIKTVPLEKSLFGEWPLFAGWMNNNTVAFQIFGHQPTTLLSVDLISGQKKELSPDFPNINMLDPWSWGYWGRTLYSPDLHYVVFPRLKDTEPHQYVLWDMQRQKEMGFMDAGHASYSPQWAPDGKKFAVAYLNSDFYMMDVNGVKKRLTDLKNEYTSYDLKIRQWSWSPSGLKIAFWLDLLSGKKLVEERLIVLDTFSLALTDYCRFGDQVQISPGTLDYAPAPVWSPDGSALLIENKEDENRSKLAIIDLSQQVVSQIGEDLYPYDWLLK